MPSVDIETSGNVERLVTALGDFELGKDFYKAAGEEVVRSIHRNIESQVQADGSALKRNAPSTNERKLKAGRPLLSLVDEHKRFIAVKSSFLIQATKKRVVVKPSLWASSGVQKLRDLVKWVQAKGFTGWFGIDAKGAKNIEGLVGKRVEKVIDKAVRR